MPDSRTFVIKPIGELMLKYMEPGCVSVDPFARDSLVASIRNDINPDTKAPSHMDAEAWLSQMDSEIADYVLFDPPYSPRQIAEVYNGIGKAWDGRNAAFYRRVRNELDRVLRHGGIAISLGWNSSGFGKGRGYKRLETLIVCHGGAHNDTIVSVERKPPEGEPDYIGAER